MALTADDLVTALTAAGIDTAQKAAGFAAASGLLVQRETINARIAAEQAAKATDSRRHDEAVTALNAQLAAVNAQLAALASAQ